MVIEEYEVTARVPICGSEKFYQITVDPDKLQEVINKLVARIVVLEDEITENRLEKQVTKIR